VRLETTIPPGEGEPVLAEGLPLMGVELDSAGPAIAVILGGLGPDVPEFTHVIRYPLRLWVEEEPDGLAVALAIESQEEGRTLVLFEREPALPEESEIEESVQV
jgi:hypothetical protein